MVGVLALVLGLSAATQAAPLDLKQVPAGAKWLVHVDVDAVRESKVVQNAWREGMKLHPECAQHLQKVHDELGIDLTKDVHGLTFYGTEVGKHTGVLIANVKVDEQKLLEKASHATDHQTTKYGSLDLHSWTDKGHGHGKPHAAAGTIYKPEYLVFSSSLDELKAAVDVLDGKSAAVASDSPLAGAVGPGTTVLARSASLAQAELPCKSPLAKQVESLQLSTGENEGKSFFDLKVLMANPEVVQQSKTIVEGGKALAAVHVGSDEVGKRLVDALQIKAEDKTLTIHWTASADDVWTSIQTHAKAWMEMKAKHQAAGKKK